MGTRLRKNRQTVWPVASINNNYPDIKYSEGNKFLEPYECFKLYYNGIQDSLREQGAFNVIPFPYDWRKSNLDQLALLKAKVDDIDNDIYIVAHSMGGVIAKLFLNYYDDDEQVRDKVKKLITLGSPWHGAPYAYKAIKYGVNIPEFFPLLMNRFTSKEVAPTFPSLYQLLPSEKYMFLCRQYEKKTFLEKDDDLISDWYDVTKDCYSPFLTSNFGDDAYTKILGEFYELLDKPLNIEHHEVIGYGKKTISTIKEATYLIEPELSFDNGDQTVPVISAMSETEHKYFIQESHNGLPKNKNVYKLVNNILIGEDDPVKDLSVFSLDYEEIKDKSFSGSAIKIACPVVVSLIDEDGNIIYGNIEILDVSDFEEILNTPYEVTTIENTTYIFVPETELEEETTSRKIIIEAYDSGPTSISVEKYRKGKVSKISAFETFNIDTTINAEINLVKNLEDTNLIIREENKKEVIVKSSIIDLENKNTEVILPQTNVFITSDDQIFLENGAVLVSDNVSLSLSDFIKGSYNVAGSYYSLNNGEYTLLLKDKVVPLELQEGKNIIKYFSRDVLGHSEQEHILIIYKINSSHPNITFKFHPYMYEINVSDNNYILLEEIGLEKPKISVQFSYKNENSDNEVYKAVNNFTIMYRDFIRSVTIETYNIFGKKEINKFAVDELSIKLLIEGTAEEQNFYDILNYLKLFPYDRIIMQKQKGKGAYKTITKEHLQNAKHIKVERRNISLEIFKGMDYLVFFQDFTQDLLIKSQDIYPIKFKVLDIKTKKEVRTQAFSATVQTTYDDEKFTSEEINFEFNEHFDYYEGFFNVKELRSFLSDFWNSDSLQEVDLVIQQKGNVTKEVITEVITVR
ncbi:lipase/acyltransferase domain-containing protein [Paenibacillus sp. M2]|uniref:lipase/acyltransferase domain-containing protein n=1 Tax=Paenibacillus sp. M2 TaxID=3341793 RepID=UPI00398A1953